MLNILVTGGAGFIGSHVVRAFSARGDSVTVLDNLSSGKRANVPEGIPLLEDDIRSTESARLVRDGGFDVICHLAAQIDVRKSVNDPMFDVSVNISGSLNLLEAVRNSRKTSTRFIFSSTGGALYGEVDDLPTPESCAKEPQSPYGNSKLAVERYLAYYARVHSLDTVALRYGNVYGPRQDSHGEAGVVAIFCERTLAGLPLVVFGDGNQTRDYVYVADVANANVLAATLPLPEPGSVDARAFNIGTGVETSVVDLAGIVHNTSGIEACIEHAPERAGEVFRSVISPAKVERILGWRAQMSIAEGVAETYQWFADQPDAIRRAASTA